MKSFYTGNLSNQDISSELTVQSFTATRDFLLIPRVKLTGLSQSATGRTMRVLIDGAAGPTKSLSDGTATSMVLGGDPLPVKSGEQVDVKVAGAAGDTSVGGPGMDCAPFTKDHAPEYAPQPASLPDLARQWYRVPSSPNPDKSTPV